MDGELNERKQTRGGDDWGSTQFQKHEDTFKDLLRFSFNILRDLITKNKTSYNIYYEESYNCQEKQA